MIKTLWSWLSSALSFYTTRRYSEATGLWLAGGTPTTAGVPVDEERSLTLSAVYAGVSLLSRLLGSLPLCVYRVEGRLREHAVDHPAYKILHDSPNPEMCAAVFRRTLEIHRLMWGNAYAEIEWDYGGRPRALWVIEPWRVRPRRTEEGKLFYKIDDSRVVWPEDMLHVQLMSLDGILGKGFVHYAAESLGLALATQEYAGGVFGNGARPGVVLEHPGQLNEEQRKQFRESWNERHKGASKVGRTAILWGGWKLAGTDQAFKPEEAQLLEQRRFSIEEVARWLNIPPHLLKDLTRSTFNNIEHQGISFVSYSMIPIVVDYEQEYNRKLLKPGMYAKHNLAALLRGDNASRSSFYKDLWGIGVFCINDILEMEDMNPIEGGDVHFVPANYLSLERAISNPVPVTQDPNTTLEDAPAKPKPDSEPDPEDPDEPDDSFNAMRGLMTATLTRMARVEGNALRRIAKKPERFLFCLEEFYGSYANTLADAIAPIVQTARLTGSKPGEPKVIAERWCAQSKREIIELSGSVVGREALLEAIEQYAQQLASDHVVGGRFILGESYHANAG